MILQHHEHPDGSGFPNGLHRDAILVASRIIAVADAVVIVAERHLPSSHASDQLLGGRGSTYDPDVVDACLAVRAHVLAPDGSTQPLAS
jgi:response regulator RpfG family c-di-GMP phosphodiesterase